MSLFKSTIIILSDEHTNIFSEDETPYDPEATVETIYFDNSRDTNQPASAIQAAKSATAAAKEAARGTSTNPLDISDMVPSPPRIRNPSEEPSGAFYIPPSNCLF